MVTFGLLGRFDNNTLPSVHATARRCIGATGDERNDARHADLDGFLQRQLECRRFDEAQTKKDFRSTLLDAPRFHNTDNRLPAANGYNLGSPDTTLAVENFDRLPLL